MMSSDEDKKLVVEASPSSEDEGACAPKSTRSNSSKQMDILTRRVDSLASEVKQLVGLVQLLLTSKSELPVSATATPTKKPSTKKSGIPKLKPVSVPRQQESTSGSGSSSPVPASVRPKIPKPLPPRDPDSEEEENDEMARLSHLLKRPSESTRPNVYSLDSGRSFRAFLSTFECYCVRRFGRDTQDEWSVELGRLLTGEILEVFEMTGGADRPYQMLAQELKEYASRQEDRLAAERQYLFQQASPLPGESLRRYALRLGRLFHRAFPKQPTEDSTVLCYKFMSSISVPAAKDLEKMLSVIKRCTGRAEVTWSVLVDTLEPDTYAERVKAPPTASPPAPVWVGSGANPKSMPQEKMAKTALTIEPQRPSRPKPAPTIIPRQLPEPSRLVCTWCGRPGHLEKECWRRLGLCLGCGSDQHFVSGCPRQHRSPSASRRSGGTGSPLSTPPQNRTTCPTCSHHSNS